MLKEFRLFFMTRKTIQPEYNQSPEKPRNGDFVRSAVLKAYKILKKRKHF